MKTLLHKIEGKTLCEVTDFFLQKPSQASDLISEAMRVEGCGGVIIRKNCLSEDFFSLSTGLAGEVIQKFVIYNYPLAIVGDFSGYTSKSLRDFIYESNKGRHVFFVMSIEDAFAKLAGI